MRRICAFIAALLSVACSAVHDAPEPAPPVAKPENSVELGVPGGPDGLDFEPMENGDELRLKTFGQGGTHVILGVRAVGFGTRAFVAFTLTDETTGTSIDAPPPVRGQLFACSDDGVCDLVPVTIMTGGLFGPDETREGLLMHIDVNIHDDAGDEASDERELVVSTADL